MLCAVVNAESSTVFSSPLGETSPQQWGFSTSAVVDGAIIDRKTDEISARSPLINARIGRRWKSSPLRQSKITVRGFMTAFIASFSSCTWSRLAGPTTEADNIGAAERHCSRYSDGPTALPVPAEASSGPRSGWTPPRVIFPTPAWTTESGPFL